MPIWVKAKRTTFNGDDFVMSVWLIATLFMYIFYIFIANPSEGISIMPILISIYGIGFFISIWRWAMNPHTINFGDGKDYRGHYIEVEEYLKDPTKYPT